MSSPNFVCNILFPWTEITFLTQEFVLQTRWSHLISDTNYTAYSWPWARSTSSCKREDYVSEVAKFNETHPKLWIHEKRIKSLLYIIALQWRHSERDGVSNDQRLDRLLNRLFRRLKKASKFHLTGLSLHKRPVTRKTILFCDVTMDMVYHKTIYLSLTGQVWAIGCIGVSNIQANSSNWWLMYLF